MHDGTIQSEKRDGKRNANALGDREGSNGIQLKICKSIKKRAKKFESSQTVDVKAKASHDHMTQPFLQNMGITFSKNKWNDLIIDYRNVFEKLCKDAIHIQKIPKGY